MLYNKWNIIYIYKYIWFYLFYLWLIYFKSSINDVKLVKLVRQFPIDYVPASLNALIELELI